MKKRPDPGVIVRRPRLLRATLVSVLLAERRTTAEVREARGLFFPSLGLQSRYSRLGGVPNIGDLINPAYATLNQLTGTSRFPTNINFTLPQAHESRLELVQPVFNLGIVANYAVARARADGQRMQLAAAARQLAADVQVAYLQEASARRAVEIYDATQVLVRENERVAERLLAAGSARAAARGGPGTEPGRAATARRARRGGLRQRLRALAAGHHSRQRRSARARGTRGATPGGRRRTRRSGVGASGDRGVLPQCVRGAGLRFPRSRHRVPIEQRFLARFGRRVVEPLQRRPRRG